MNTREVYTMLPNINWDIINYFNKSHRQNTSYTHSNEQYESIIIL